MKFFTKLILATSLTCLCFIPSSSFADTAGPGERTITITNETDYTLKSLFFRGIGEDEWSPELLEDDSVGPGATFDLDIILEEGDLCDVMVQYELVPHETAQDDGRPQGVKPEFNICTDDALSITMP